MGDQHPESGLENRRDVALARNLILAGGHRRKAKRAEMLQLRLDVQRLALRSRWFLFDLGEMHVVEAKADPFVGASSAAYSPNLGRPVGAEFGVAALLGALQCGVPVAGVSVLGNA
jgi:hypothetical protein